MFTLTKEFRFEAAHRLPHHDGKCARLHGHSWRGRVILKGDALYSGGPKAGMLIDFGDVSAILSTIVEERLDHHYLNESLKMENPTSEHVAWWLYKQLGGQTFGDVELIAVEIDETCTSSVRYSPNWREDQPRFKGGKGP